MVEQDHETTSPPPSTRAPFLLLSPAGGDTALIVAAACAFLWAVARAATQSITIDEADTYLAFVGRHGVLHWYPAANNHVLNSVLMRLSTLVLGASALTVRLPALLGAALYIAASLVVCRRVHANAWGRLLLFLGMVYNPFVGDFLVAARGYGLALALLVWAVAVPACGILKKEDPVRLSAACSILTALSFSANFSFGFAEASILLAILIWIGRTSGFCWRVLIAAIVPGAAVVVLLPLSTLVRWRPGQLWVGATSLREMFGSVIHWSWYELNPEVSNPLLFRGMRAIEHPLLVLFAAVILARLLILISVRSRVRSDRSRWLAGLAAVCGGGMVLAVLLHFIAYRLFGLLLPRDRTALFFVPLLAISIGALTATPLPSSRGFRIVDQAANFIYPLVILHFLLCLRLSYFGEWRYDADVKDTYSELVSYGRQYCLTDVASGWEYRSPLNFYRSISGSEDFSIRDFDLANPPEAQLYVLNAKRSVDFIKRQGLAVLYSGDSSDVVIAARPGLESRSGSGQGCR